MATRSRWRVTVSNSFRPEYRVISFILFNTLLICCASVTNGNHVSKHHLNVVPFGISPPTADLDLRTIPSVARDVFGSFDSEEPIIPFDSLQQTLVLHDNEAEAVFSFSFLPEDRKNVSLYSLEVECSDTRVLKPEDVDLGPPIVMENGRANYTVDAIFARMVGQTTLSLIFKRQDRSEYARVSVHFTICGISFFHVTETGKRVFLANNKLELTSHQYMAGEELLVFYVLIQFPDGTSSESTGRNIKRLPSFSNLNLTLSGGDLLGSHEFETCLKGHAIASDNGNYVLEDICSFGFTEFSNTKMPYFLVRLLKYRTGSVRFHFGWEDLLQGTLLEDMYETYLDIHISGKAPPAITAINPQGPFRKSGGQLLECAVINSSPDEQYTLTIGSTALKPTSIRRFQKGWVVFTFVTPKGQGYNVPWDLTYISPGVIEPQPCRWAGGSERFVFNYVEEDIIITSLKPNHGPVQGGVTITCSGFFGNFSLATDSGDRIVLGTHVLERKNFISVTKTELIFVLPALEELQSPTHEVSCVVIVHGIRSNEVFFTYESLSSAVIRVTGGSYDESNDSFLVPVCKSSKSKDSNGTVALFANVNDEASLEHLSFHWRIVIASSKVQVHTISGHAEAQSMLLPVSMLSTGVEYNVTVLISDSRFKSQLQSPVRSFIRIKLTNVRMLGVGMSVDRTRSIAFPPVDARATAFVTEQGNCKDAEKRLSYEWTFMSSTKTLSSSSAEVDDKSPSPRRFGREYIVPRTKLVYGQHKVQVKVFYADEPEVYGIAHGTLNVQPAILQAVIGSGESRVQVSGASDLEMSAGSSYDPDNLKARAEDSLEFHWDCELSTEGGDKFTSASLCNRELLPSVDKEKFILRASTLQSVRFFNQSTFVRYSLYVRKSYRELGVRTSARVTQIVEILSHDDSLAARVPVLISNAEGHRVDVTNVPYYDACVLSPSLRQGISWRFGVVEPAVDQFKLLKNPNNLLALPGFFASNDRFASQRSLGIRAGVLKPDTVYRFEIQYESNEADHPNSAEVSIRTMRKPTLTFPPMHQTNGTTQTTFSAIAIPSVEHYAFKFYFYLELEDGTRMCVDGCSGQRKVWFRIPVVGTHTIQCVMEDSRGKYVIAKAKQSYNLTVHEHLFEEETQVLRQSESLQNAFDLGDHSSFELECLRLSQYTHAISTNDTRQQELSAELVSKTLSKLADLYSKTQPNTPLARDYLTLTLSFASLPLGHAALGSHEVFYNLIRMLHNAIINTPFSNRFDITRAFTRALTLLTAHARQLHSGGTTRMRLQSLSDHTSSHINEELLCVSEEAAPLSALVLTRSDPCGSTAKLDIAELGVIHAGVFCNSEHGTSLGGEHATLSWCDSLFSSNGRRRVAIGLGELVDYVQDSGVLSMRDAEPAEPSTREGEVMLQTGNMASHGFALAHPVVALANGGEIEPIGGCFRIEMELRSTRAVFPTYEEVSCGDATAVEYVNRKTLGEALHEKAYTERVVASKAVSRRDNRNGGDESGRVTAQLSRVSDRVFGVKRRECADLKPRVIGEIYGVKLPSIAIVGVIVAIIAVGVLGVRKGSKQMVWIEGEDAAYIERDVHGRDLGVFDDGLAVDAAVDDEEEEVFRNPTPRGRNTPRPSAANVDGLFAEE